MQNRYRLDANAQPVSYSIEIEPDLHRFTFKGREQIGLTLSKATPTLTLHALELTIREARIRPCGCGNGHSMRAVKITYDSQYETATLRFAKPIPAGDNHILELSFEGEINDKMHGFYRTAYTVDGRKHWGGATQFEATDARRAFPCWDEPECKATFEMALRVPKHLTALSNMPIVSQRGIPGTHLKEVRYETTPRMSTYLLAWVIAELECVRGKDGRGVPVNIWTTVGKKHQGKFALAAGKAALDYFGRWFGIPYALPKLDMVALPDFAAGAMENWGLVTYRETALLVDAKNSSVHAKQRVADVIAHELAHQWFGNLVTMSWWTDLWLNEGFASYMGPKAVDDQFPGWDVWNQFVATEYLAALRDDSLRSSHPIEIPVKNPAEIREIFDHITYSKGSSVNRMLEHYLTEPVFRKGLGVYLKRYAYGNAATNDLWKALEEVSGKPVRAIMASYTRQDGYPVVAAEETAGGKGLRLTQKRFFFDGQSDRAKRRWSVPIVALVEGHKAPVYGMLQRSSVVLPVRARDGWVKINAGQSGFYRTAYSPALFDRVCTALEQGALPATDCMGLLDDTLALARAGHMRTTQALELTTRCGRYPDYNVWLTLSGILHCAELLLEQSDERPALHRLAFDLLHPVYRRTGWTPKRSDTHLGAMLRSLVLGRLGHYGDATVIAEAQERFARFMATGELAPDLRGCVFGITAEHGSEKEYNQLVAAYRKAELQEERVRILRALTLFRDEHLVRRTLDFAFSEEVRKQDAFMLLSGYGANPAGRGLAWERVKRSWKELTARYASGGLNLMNRIIEGSTTGFADAAALRDVERFFRAHPVAGTERVMRQSLEVIRATLQWKRRDLAALEQWLAGRSAAGGR